MSWSEKDAKTTHPTEIELLAGVAYAIASETSRVVPAAYAARVQLGIREGLEIASCDGMSSAHKKMKWG